MSEWLSFPLVDLVQDRQISYGVVQPGNDSESGVPIVRVKDVRNGTIDASSPLRVDKDIAAKHSRTTLVGGELLLSLVGTVGESAVAPAALAGWNVARAIAVIRPTEVSSRWLQLCFESAPIRSEILGVLNTTVQSTLNLADLKRLRIPVPPVEVRSGIEEVLGALDDKIAANAKLSNTSISLLEANFRVLGLNRAPAADEDIIGIDELIEFNPKMSAPDEAEPIYVDMQKLPVSNMSIGAWERRPAKGGARFMNGDTLLARITPCLENRKTGFVDFLHDGQVGIGSTEFIVLRSRRGVPSELTYFLATSERFRTFAIRHMVGTSGRQRVSALDLTGYTLGKPNETALAQFGATAAPTFRLVKSLTDENRTLAATRDALLPQLMSGKLRVKDTEKILEDAGYEVGPRRYSARCSEAREGFLV